jgi:hypothetical protein
VKQKFYTAPVLLLLLAGFVSVKWALIPLVHWFDADAVSRHHMTQDLARDFRWLPNGNWPPVFFYVQVLFYELLPSWISPLVITVLLNGFSCLFLWKAVRRFYSPAVALATTVVFALCPLVFRMSMVNLAETMYLFFVMAGVAVLATGYKHWTISTVVGAGVLFTLAAGVRYEAIIIAAMIAGWMAMQRLFTRAFVLFFVSALFPVYWMASNAFYSEHALSSLQWSANAIANNRIDSGEALIRRLGWFPVSLLLCIGPYGCVLLYQKRKAWLDAATLGTLRFMPLAYLILSISMCLLGSLLLQHRFTLTSYLLCLPIIAVVLSESGIAVLRKGIVWAVVSFVCSYIYTTRDLQPLPRLNVEQAHVLLAKLKNNLQPSDGFIHAFFDWQISYFLLYHSGVESKDIEYSPPGSTAWHQLDRTLQQHTAACAIIERNSPLLDSLMVKSSQYGLSARQIADVEGVLILRLERKGAEQHSQQ